MNSYSPAAFCTKHGIFPARAIALGAFAKLTISNCTINCPVCNEASEILPGAYEVVGGRMNLLLDPSVTPEALQALKAIAERLQRNEISKEEAQAEAAKISFKFRDLFKGIKQETVAALAGAIIAAATAVYVAKTSAPVVVNNNYGTPPPSVSEVVSAIPSYPSLPRIGPVPSDKPLNRHERRKIERTTRAKQR